MAAKTTTSDEAASIAVTRRSHPGSAASHLRSQPVRWDEEIEHRAVELDRAAALALADPCLCAGRRGPAASSARRLGGHSSITFQSRNCIFAKSLPTPPSTPAGNTISALKGAQSRLPKSFAFPVWNCVSAERLQPPTLLTLPSTTASESGDFSASGWPSHAP